MTCSSVFISAVKWAFFFYDNSFKCLGNRIPFYATVYPQYGHLFTLFLTLLCQIYRTIEQCLLAVGYSFNKQLSASFAPRYNGHYFFSLKPGSVIVYITDKCEYVSVQNQQYVVLQVCGNNYLLPYCFFFFSSSFSVGMCMAVWKCVCVWLILYIWCFKMETCPDFF